jgi:hypothetical protein
MSKYIVTRKDDEGKTISMTFEFSETDHKFLKSMIVDGEWESPVWRGLWHNPPFTEDTFLKWHWPGNKVELIPEDLSFARFWEEFANKTGNKDKVEKQFNALSNAIKMEIFKAIPRYHRYLTVTGFAQAMASTWLNNERWNDSYSTKPKNQT